MPDEADKQKYFSVFKQFPEGNQDIRLFRRTGRGS